MTLIIFDDCQLNGGRLTNKQCTGTTVPAAIAAVKSRVAFGEESHAFLLITARLELAIMNIPS